jgi:hypothetical protein
MQKDTTKKTPIYVFTTDYLAIHNKSSTGRRALSNGARNGQYQGLSGKSYAIPIRNGNLELLSKNEIFENINRFLAWTSNREKLNEVYIISKLCRNTKYYYEVMDYLRNLNREDFRYEK